MIILTNQSRKRGDQMKTIKQLRLEKQWTQKQLGSKFAKQKSPEVISRWEKGNSRPNVCSLRELSSIFGVSSDSILID